MLSLVVHWGDMARWLVMLAPLLVGGVALQLLQRRRMTRPWGRPVRSGPYSLRKLEGHGWPQRLSPGWAIGAWLVPVVNFWFPFRIMVDIWRAGLPEQPRTKIAILPGMWWASVLAFFYLLLSDVPTGPPHPAWHVSMPLYGTWVLAAIMTALLVQKVSSGPVGLKDGDARLVPRVVNPPGD
jgi:hypothetical protein